MLHRNSFTYRNKKQLLKYNLSRIIFRHMRLPKNQSEF